MMVLWPNFQFVLSVPSLNESGMIIFMVLAGLGAIYSMRRLRTSNS